jgi:hypothetical protein
MKKRYYFLLFLISIGLYGCFGWKPFQPAQDLYLIWTKPGKSQIDVKKSLLECGYTTIYFLGAVNQMNRNDMLLADVCMKNQGYLYANKDYCSSSIWYNDPPSACSPGVVIPEPSVEQRLNSRYCKSKNAHNTPECQP